jgi:hypothetical protein
MGRNTQPTGGILTFGLLFLTNTNICSGHSDEGTGPLQNRLWEDCRSAEKTVEPLRPLQLAQPPNQRSPMASSIVRTMGAKK